MDDNNIKCALCGKDCGMQVSRRHLQGIHNMTTFEYKALGYETLSPARLQQLKRGPVAQGRVRHLYGEEHPNWKGGHIAGSGYKIVSKRGKTNLYEHRLVAAQMLGRELLPGEVVHHIDGNRSNNDPSNLQVMQRHEHDQLKDGCRAWFHTNDDSVKAALFLFDHGWSKRRIAFAIRVQFKTVQRWIQDRNPEPTVQG